MRRFLRDRNPHRNRPGRGLRLSPFFRFLSLGGIHVRDRPAASAASLSWRMTVCAGSTSVGIKRLALLFFLLLAARARAHHIVSEYGIAFVEPSSIAEVDTQAAEFRLGDRSGHWQLVALSLEYAVTPRLSFSGRLPFARIRYDAGSTEYGPGDAEVAAKVGLVATQHGGLLLSAGASFELPTGSEKKGLGAGHFEISPFVTASSAPVNNLVLYGVLADRISTGSAEAPGEAHGSVLAPHSDHELTTRLGAAYVRGPAYLSGGIEYVEVFVPSLAAGPLVLRGEFGILFQSELRLAFGFDAPVAGPHRYGWRGRLGIAWFL